MFDINNYIDSNGLKRTYIAMDIKNGNIGNAEIEKIIASPYFKKSKIGKTFVNKKDETSWNKEYLEKLSYMAVAESFNEDYLYYLKEVADYVNSSKKDGSKLKLFCIIFFASLIVFIVTIFFVKKYRIKNNDKQTETMKEIKSEVGESIAEQ